MGARQEFFLLSFDERFRVSMLSFLAFLLLPMFLGSECAQNCSEKLKEANLVPKYTNNVPGGDLKIIYDKPYEAECGNKLPVLATKNAPMVIYDVQGKCKYVSIISFDPDVPVLVKNIYLHWFVTNIPASVLKRGYDGQAGNERASYFSPLGITGDHRYTFCAYCQKTYIRGGRTYDGIHSRLGINPKCLMKENHLYTPEACNFFYLTAVDTSKLKDLPVG